MRRITARIFDQFPHAWDLNEVLLKGGIDSKIVTKHAVQIRPDQMDHALDICRDEKARRVAAEIERASA